MDDLIVVVIQLVIASVVLVCGIIYHDLVIFASGTIMLFALSLRHCIWWDERYSAAFAYSPI